MPPSSGTSARILETVFRISGDVDSGNRLAGISDGLAGTETLGTGETNPLQRLLDATRRETLNSLAIGDIFLFVSE